SAKAHAPAKISKPAEAEAPAKPKVAAPPAPKAHVAPPAKPRVEPAAKPVDAPKPKPVAPRGETVSLIDEKKPKAKRTEADGAVKRTFLPPISRLREPAAPPRPPAAPPAAPVAPETPPVAAEPAAPSAEPEADAQKIIHIKPPIIVKELASQLGLKPHQLIAELMALNIFANVNQTVEPDVATQICQKHGFVFEMERREKGGGVHKVEQVVVAPPPPVIEKEEELKIRGPIITFMGHVDHGKTSLMDAIRKTRVAAGEAGGITQHIGVYTVDYKGSRITFIDTPGHQAFTAMRARGAHVTDIVVLVVAADDGIKEQTVEAIRHAKAAKVPMIVAINKMDKPDAKPDRVRQELLQHEIVVEHHGGDVLDVEVSALKKTNLDKLEEAILLQAELLDLKANPNRPAEGVVLEAKLERGRGAVATVLIQRGTLRVGDIFVAGGEWGRVRALVDERGQSQ